MKPVKRLDSLGCLIMMMVNQPIVNTFIKGLLTSIAWKNSLAKVYRTILNEKPLCVRPLGIYGNNVQQQLVVAMNQANVPVLKQKASLWGLFETTIIVTPSEHDNPFYGLSRRFSPPHNDSE